MSEHEPVSVNDIAKRLLEPWKPRGTYRQELSAPGVRIQVLMRAQR
jgi:hypothetical protein